jgi:hypothetical protein
MRTKEIDKLLKETFKNDRNRYNDGNCVEMAIAIHKTFPKSKIVVGHRFWTNDGQDLENPLSHAVTEIEGQTFDSEGSDAIKRWEELYEYPFDCGGDEDVHFDWDQYTETDLKKLVKKYRGGAPLINNKLISELKGRLEKKILKNRKKSCEIHKGL